MLSYMSTMKDENSLALSFWNEVKNLRVGRKPHTTRFFVVPIRGEGESGLLQNDNKAIFRAIPRDQLYWAPRSMKID